MLGIATLTTIAALAFAAVTIGNVLERFVTRGLDQQLDAQVNVLARAVRPDGTLDQARAISLPAFEEQGSGWGWRVDGLAGHWASGAAIVTTLEPLPPRPPHGRNDGRARELRPHPGEGRDARGERVHFRQLALPTKSGPVLLTAAGPRRVAVAPLREAMVPLLLSLALLGGALAVATVLQLRFGLRPLRRLRNELAEVRAGRLRHIPIEQPAEIAPLATELNALIDQNEAGLAHARRHVSNLAHGLKTPLAALSVKLAEVGRDPDGSLGEMVTQIDQRVCHHLGRARAAAPGSNRRTRTPLAPAVADLTSALQRIHAEWPISVVMEIADIAVAVDSQDLDEMVGNLLDNASRYARSAIRITAHAVIGTVELAIDDDGPGLSEAAMGEALVPGRRLDERGGGHGFGLSIAQELAELNGGSLVLSRSPQGGLRATMTLPVAV
ncbi:sensor histidine kinase [Sphingomonas oligophenolica]|uniref:sensor histidine kinase n=1 Tax=Sphingomonas oligophenolica TaxID=301154 RepID=UPI001F4FAC69|nr:HAMP domain-containing sensor histidine kinase [Sphingomonas oligophenolica]